ncbi:MAG: ROK family protein [Pseudomonadota bacterium]|nr:ROK family protein [Pseudomonadota bacterium]
MTEYPLLAGVELGGTKAIVVLGRGEEIVERHRFPTTTPVETLPLIAKQLRRWGPAALGIASFGPIDLDPASATYGEIFATPKPGWAGTNLIAELAGLVDGPALLSTDVIAAALAEGEWGAARGCRDHAYITVGTGIGVGVVAGGQPLTGRLHPEAGHMRVARVSGDRFEGNCAYHGDCLEGLASGPAIAARTGVKGEATADDHPAWAYVIEALAQGCANLLLTLASERITLGGGVIVERRWLVPAIEARMTELVAGYFPYVVKCPILRVAELGGDAGPRGALLLARTALAGA